MVKNIVINLQPIGDTPNIYVTNKVLLGHMHPRLFILSLAGPLGQYVTNSYDQRLQGAHSLKCILPGSPQQAVNPCLGSDGFYTPDLLYTVCLFGIW